MSRLCVDFSTTGLALSITRRVMAVVITSDMVAGGLRDEFARRPSLLCPGVVLEGLTDVLTTTGLQRQVAGDRLAWLLQGELDG